MQQDPATKGKCAMRRFFTAVLLLALVSVSAPANASEPDFGGPTKSPQVLHNDHFTFCATAIQGWVNMPVQRNDVNPPDTRITDTGQPNQGHGQAQIVQVEHKNVLQYRNTLGPLGTKKIVYEVHYPSGEVDIAYWRVTVDRFC